MQLLDCCSFLEGFLGLEGFLKKIKESSSSPREVKKELIKLDSFSLVTESKTHSSTSLAAEIAESTYWLKIWDLALDFGLWGTSAIQSLFSIMTRPVFGSAPCTFRSQQLILNISFQATFLPINKEEIKEELKKEHPDINFIIRLFSPNHMSTLRQLE